MKVKVKKLHKEAVIPTYAKPGDAGLDLHATEVAVDKNGNWVCHTSLSFEIPEGYVGLIFPRSSISKTGFSLRNSVGVIDSGYRGEIILKFSGDSNKGRYKGGDRIGQLIIMPYPTIELVESEELSTTERADGGFGSTGQ